MRTPNAATMRPKDSGSGSRNKRPDPPERLPPSGVMPASIMIASSALRPISERLKLRIAPAMSTASVGTDGSSSNPRKSDMAVMQEPMTMFPVS